MKTREHNLYDIQGDFDGVCTVIPDNDLATIGKQRQGTVAWICGDFVEQISTSSLWLTGIAPEPSDITRPPMTEEEISTRCATRARKNVRRIINTNRMRFMWTFTLAPDGKIPLNLQADYNEVRKCWKAFIRKAYREFGRFPWLVVLELHDSSATSETKKGTFHIHFATSKRLPWKKVGEVWGLGFVRFDDFNKNREERGGTVRNPGAYMSKYVGKCFAANSRHLKRYSCSRSVKRPQKVSGVGLERFCRNHKITLVEVFRKERGFESGFAIYGTCEQAFKITKENHG